ncbi:hypothetical protein AJ79_06752 [Helicocarpus griseus UAMH5409]|uniref:EamA domain-containing protein n=1 Tax=Helicocarpus griseus UAMH5409 TaxID=1447875 RepID=A0A2B7X9E2_9EURO|nr:hypothetical protein AJ79_06752 [Helicocarpus griseus UAMH5409]
MVRRRTNKLGPSPDEDLVPDTDTSVYENKAGSQEHKEQANEKNTGSKEKDAHSPASSSSSSSLPNWVILAITSGLFAATNGLFAKLTTTHLTTTLSHSLSALLSLPPSSQIIAEYVVRALFFTLNILSNGVMWALFTRALTASASSTKVAITNTTANFLLTALLGMMVFGERVDWLWWIGAVGMAGGCVVVGMREGEAEGEKGKGNWPK